MVIRRVRAKARNNGGRPKKSSSLKLKSDEATSSHSDSDSHRERDRTSCYQPNAYANSSQQNQQFQQLLLAANNATSNGANSQIDFDFPAFFQGIANGSSNLGNGMPKLIADSGVKVEIGSISVMQILSVHCH